MKKLIFIISLLVVSFATQAQMLTTNLDHGVSYANVTTNYTLTNNVAQYWLIYTQPDWYTAQEFIISLDSLAGNHTNVAVAVFGRVSDQMTWAQIGSTVNWKGTTADTTFAITNATEVKYRQYKVLFTGTGTGTTTIDRMEFKYYNGLP